MKYKTLIILIMSAITMIICILIGSIVSNQYVFAFGMTQFILLVTGCIISNLKGVSLSQAVKYNEDQLNNAIKERNPIEILAYGSAIPALGVGILMIAILTISLWFVKF